MITLSIIVPIYNVEKYLDECLQSVVGIDDVEIILINDCTPDGSVEIAQSYVDQFENIKLIHHTENKGLGATRNTGIAHAKGKYIFFLDSDDYLDRTKLELLIKTLQDVEHEQVIVSFIRFLNKDEVLPFPWQDFYTKYNGKVLTNENFKELLTLINLATIRIIKRDKILTDNIKFPDGLYEDILWSFWFSYSCTSTLVIDSKIYFYRQRNTSILNSKSKKHIDLITQYKNCISLFKVKKVPITIISLLEQQFLNHSKYIMFYSERLTDTSKNDFCKKTIFELEKYLKQKSNLIEKLDKEFANISKIRFRYHPIKKIKAFGQLTRVYYSLKSK